MRVIESNPGQLQVLGRTRADSLLDVLEVLDAWGGWGGDVSATHVIKDEGRDGTLEWVVGDLGAAVRHVSVVSVLGSSVKFLGGVHRERVPASQVLSRQILNRFNTYRPLAPRHIPYIPRTLYVTPLPRAVTEPMDLVTFRLELLVTGEDSITNAMWDCGTDEERAVAAYHWHERVFETVEPWVDDASQAVMATVLPLMRPGLAKKIRLAERWILMVRVVLSAPTEWQLLTLISYDKVNKTKPRALGSRVRKRAKFIARHPFSNRKMKRLTVVPCTAANHTLGLEYSPPLNVEHLRGVAGTRMANLVGGLPEPRRELAAPFEAVPELVARGRGVLERGVVYFHVHDLWALRSRRTTMIPREEVRNLWMWARCVVTPSARTHSKLRPELPPIEEFHLFVPSCVGTLMSKMKGGHLNHAQRYGLVPLLHRVGYDNDTIRVYLESQWGPRWNANDTDLHKDLDDFAKDAEEGDNRQAGCGFMRARGFCPFKGEGYQSACFEYGQETHRIRSKEPKIFSPMGYLTLSLPRET